MPRRRVELCIGEYYHVYNRGVDRQPIFFSRSNYLYFLRLLRRDLLGESVPDTSSVRDTGVDVICYCLMPNHYHLLVQLKSDDFSQRMKSLGQSYTEAVNRQLQRVGPLFQGRFQAVHVDEESYLLHLSRYIHRNPLRANLVRSAEEWEFSSYREFIGRRRGSLPVFGRLLEEAGGRDGYRHFVETEAESVGPDLQRYLIGR